MPDITLCINDSCPLKEKCGRNEMHWKKVKSEFQCYAHFDISDNMECFSFFEKQELDGKKSFS